MQIRPRTARKTTLVKVVYQMKLAHLPFNFFLVEPVSTVAICLGAYRRPLDYARACIFASTENKMLFNVFINHSCCARGSISPCRGKSVREREKSAPIPMIDGQNGHLSRHIHCQEQ